MAQPIFDDITPPQGGDKINETQHSIQDVSPLDTQERETRRKRRATRRQIAPKRSRRKHGNGSIGIWIIAIIIFFVALSTIGLMFMGKTILRITPLQETLTLTPNIVYTAYRNAESGELGFKVLTKDIDESDSLIASGSETVKVKASGRITVYNTYSSAPLRLIKNTRFEDPSGNIYRIRKSLIVPGKHSDGTAGVIDVTVYADIEGENQNSTTPKTRFSIPGLKNDSRYSAFYAILKEPIIGGFIGERPVVDEAQLNAMRTSLREKLRSQVVSTIKEKLPNTSLLFDDGVFTTFESMPIVYTDAHTATVHEVAHVQAVTFNALSFAHMIAITTLAAPKGGDILINDPSKITMSIVNRKGVDIASDSLIQFTLKGPAVLTWHIDTKALKRDLIGKSQVSLNTVMKGYPGIKSVTSTIRPFWKKEFPTDAGRITVDIIPKK